MAVNTRKRPPDVLVDEKWDIVSDTISAILNKTMSRYSFQQVHHSVFQLCQRQCSALLFDHVESVLSTHVKCIRDQLLKTPEDSLLWNLKTEWDDFCLAVRRISEALLYLNNNHTSHRETIQQMGEGLFYSIALKDEDISKRFVTCVRESPTSEKHSRMALKELSVKLRELYRDIFYEPYVEDPLISVWTERYREEVKVMLSASDIKEYLIWALNVIEEARVDVSNLVGDETARRVERSLSLLLIKENTETLLYSESGGGATMVRNMDAEAIGYLALALEKVNETDACFDMIVATCKAMGSELLHVEDETISAFAVEKVLNLRDNMQSLVDTLPNLPKGDKSPVSRALSEIVNDKCGFAEKLAHYYDTKIKAHLSEEALTQVSSDTFSLFCLLQAKDEFEHVFKLLLSARLINLRPEESIVQEMPLIDQLRNESRDSVVVNHLDIMLRDGKMRNEINKGFLRYLGSDTALPLSFNVAVLTAGIWPQYTDLGIQLPDAMQNCMHLFRSYYLLHHNGRKLFFHTSLGTVYFAFNHRKMYELVAPTAFVNTIISFQNNENDKSMTLQQICQKTGMSEGDILHQLESLSQLGLITVDRSGEFSFYAFNHSFTYPRNKIRVRSANGTRALRDAAEPRAHRDSLEASHSANVQAAVVQIMKSEKTLGHAELCSRVMESFQKMRFTPGIAEIKHSLDALMSKGLISRGPRPDTYIYEV